MVNRREFLLTGSAACALPSTKPVFASSKLAPTELVLALDASASMVTTNLNGFKNWDTQIAVHIYALEQEEIVEMFVDGQIYLRIIVWSDGRKHALVFDAPILSPHDVNMAKTALTNFRLDCGKAGCAGTLHHTAIETVLSLPRKGYSCVLDIATDGALVPETQQKLNELRSDFQKMNGVINVLAINMTETEREDLKSNLCTQYGECFSASNWLDCAEALKRKIIAEIA